MTIAIDPILCNIVYTINLVSHLRRPNIAKPEYRPYENSTKHFPKEELPMLSVLLPLFEERLESILTVARCIAKQTYPKDKFEVLLILEPQDVETRRYAEEAVKLLQSEGIDGRIVFTDGVLKLKPHALNCALKEAKGEVICVYDADDTFNESQLEDAVTLMLERDYDVIQPKIFRKRETLAGSFLTLDSFCWTRKFLPTFYDMAKIFPLSGEAFFIKREAIEEAGGWPEVLTEDAYLSIILAEKNKKFGLLDSEVEELAPKGWKSQFKQRLRWFRGYLTCLGRTLKAKLPLKQKLTLLIPFLAPITCASSLITWTFLIVYWLTWAFMPIPKYIAPWMLHWLYPGVIGYWSAFLAYIGNPIVMFSLMHSIAGTPMERRAPLALIIPFYWMFLGIAAIASLFRSTKYWGKTLR